MRVGTGEGFLLMPGSPGWSTEKEEAQSGGHAPRVPETSYSLAFLLPLPETWFSWLGQF